MGLDLFRLQLTLAMQVEYFREIGGYRVPHTVKMFYQSTYGYGHL
jgi:hypothetical protein